MGLRLFCIKPSTFGLSSGDAWDCNLVNDMKTPRREGSEIIVSCATLWMILIYRSINLKLL